MWSNLPFDVLANIFSFLSPDSFACAKTACHHWYNCANAYPSSPNPSLHHHPPWFVALPTHGPAEKCCYVHNPATDKWHRLSTAFLLEPIRPVGPIGSLVLSRTTNSNPLQLVLFNPFTRQFKYLPRLNLARTNPAVGVIVLGTKPHSPFHRFRVYVAGGLSEAPPGCATYESAIEMYDSDSDTWQIMGDMPVQFAVRLTVWTPNESVYCNGVVYWMTSARVYSLMGFEIGPNKWQELSLPMAERLEFATLVPRNGKLTLVGGVSSGDACVWELDERKIWCLVEKVPTELGLKLLGGKASWGSTKCVSGGGAICLYRDLGSGMVVWREDGGRRGWKWFWVEGCGSFGGKQMHRLSIRGVLIHPCIAPSCIP
ncbi:hypothetical protein Tsubulata_045725 [Turnera subulata]|uniref:F-box domain-containing protein n=1 Tax=Turnera subulata TaxID=218843 RepID=A0A9Q0FKS9_9ROSI|nr:hypothetical protein Tsubulata_045725 [Turnera subulata]